MVILLLIAVLLGSSTLHSAYCASYYEAEKQLPFVIHICSYNNKPWVVKNLQSVFMQKYDNFRVVYVDDASSDGTADEVRAYLDAYNLWDRVTLVANTVRCRKMTNMYSTIRLCDDCEIIVQLDGDDWFSDDQLLVRLNHVYQTQDVWMTYGSYRDYPSNKRGYCESTPHEWVEKKLFRKRKWLYMHPRSFYAWLFKAIKVQDHIAEFVEGYQGEFFPSADDQASYWPMLEMAGERFAYVPEISYICNRGNPLCGRVFESPLQSACGGDARKRSPYATLEFPQLDVTGKYKDSFADVILISSNNPHGAETILRSVDQYVTGVEQVMVFYVVDRIEADSYERLKKQFPHIEFIQCWDANIFYQLAQYVQHIDQEHILLLRDRITFIDTINISTFIQHLEATSAYGVYFAFEPYTSPFFNIKKQQSDIKFVHLYDIIYAWKFSCGTFALFNNIDATLMRKKDVLKRMHTLVQQKENDFFSRFYDVWQKDTHVDQHAIGLFLEKSPLEGACTEINMPIQLPKCLHVKQKTKKSHTQTHKKEKWPGDMPNLTEQLVKRWKVKKHKKGDVGVI